MTVGVHCYDLAYHTSVEHPHYLGYHLPFHHLIITLTPTSAVLMLEPIKFMFILTGASTYLGKFLLCFISSLSITTTTFCNYLSVCDYLVRLPFPPFSLFTLYHLNTLSYVFSYCLEDISLKLHSLVWFFILFVCFSFKANRIRKHNTQIETCSDYSPHTQTPCLCLSACLSGRNKKTTQPQAIGLALDINN